VHVRARHGVLLATDATNSTGNPAFAHRGQVPVGKQIVSRIGNDIMAGPGLPSRRREIGG
jgi:hypothetical protein